MGTTTTQHFTVGQRVRFISSLYVGVVGTVEAIKDNGLIVVRGGPLHGRGGAGFSTEPEHLALVTGG